MGHRNPGRGIITISSLIKNESIYYGVSYCSPKEPKYDKKLGIELATSRMMDNIKNNISISLTNLKHSDVVLSILGDILCYTWFPKWAYDLLLENITYPIGLTRFNKTNSNNPFNIEHIVVDSVYSKEQLIKALDYLATIPFIDHEFVAVSRLLNIVNRPDIIKVKQ